MDIRYTRTARILHWLVAVLAAVQIGLGLGADRAARPVARSLMEAHVQIGLAILALMLARIAWRLGHPPPPLPDSLSPAQRRGAAAAHTMLQVLMVVLPVSGYLLWMWIGAELRFLGGPVIPVPDLSGGDEFWRSLAGYTHEYAFYALAALLALHISAAIVHEARGHFRPLRDRMGLGISGPS